MGKQEQNRHTSEITNHKTNPSFKWGRMFHLLDYHHWYYVKKVLANKKPHAKSNAKEAHNHSSSDPVHYARMSSIQIREPIDKPQLQEHGIHPCVSTESSSLPSSPTTTPSHRLSTSPSTKGSRATRIKRKIAREVSKRTGRHRRSSTCPVNSELGGTNPNHNHVEDSDDGVIGTMENGIMVNHNINHGENASCGLCTKMKIECPLGDENLVDMQGELSLNHMNRILQENLDGSHSRKQIRRTVSLQQSIESLDVRELMSKNKSFFLRIVDDQGSSLEKNKSEEHVLKSSRKNPLKRFGTFPINHLSCKRDDSSDVLRKGVSQKSYSKASSHKYARLEKCSTLNDRNHAPRIRFKDLRHKIKHVIKESKIDRHIIAMDAVLHKVPYGQKVPEESTTKDNISPRVSSTCDSESIISPSPDSGKYTKTYKRRSPSLDESLDKYCNLFETTSSSKDIKTDTHNKSRLRVMDDYLDKRERKKLGRMFSFPDLQYFLNNQRENNYSGELCSRTPNKRIMSFNERKVMNDVLIVDFDYRHKFNDGYESSSKEDDDGVDEKLNSSNIDMTSSRSSIEVLSCDKDRESVTTSICEDDVHKLSETPFGDAESKLQEATKQLSEDQSYSESPTFSFTNIDEDEAKHSIEQHISPSLKRVEIDNNDIEEFNYVKEILHLSGYLGTELLGTWYSSDQPVDPSIFIEFESCSIHEPTQSTSLKEISYNNHLSLFDVINETLLAIYERSVSYWCAPLSTCSRTHPMPKGYRILDEVWSNIKWYTNCSKPELDPSLDCITTRDLAKDDRWMNLQFDAECVGLEVEELIFEDLLDELTS